MSDQDKVDVHPSDVILKEVAFFDGSVHHSGSHYYRSVYKEARHRTFVKFLLDDIDHCTPEGRDRVKAFVSLIKADGCKKEPVSCLMDMSKLPSAILAAPAKQSRYMNSLDLWVTLLSFRSSS